MSSSMEPLEFPEDVMSAFGAWAVVRIDRLTSTAEARAAATRRARAPLVAFVEDHCFPTPTWADALIAAHARPWAGAGPAVFNANPATRVSWANLLIEYGERLGSLMEAESILQWTLQRLGHRFTIEPRAHTRHENFSRFGPSISLRFHGGRLFAASRAKAWTAARRLLYALGSPLIPFLRLARAQRDRRRVGSAANKRGLAMVMFALLVTDAAGELVGYLIGAGRSSVRLSDLEFHRERFLVDGDRRHTATGRAFAVDQA